MKVIFLDIDGVLNSRQHVIRLNRKREFDPYRDEFCPVASSNLLYLLEESPHANIVVSSTWRLGKTLEELQTLLKDMAEVSPERVIGKTPAHRDRYRGKEIDEWLNTRTDVDRFVIIDDDSDMEPHMKRLVQTDNTLGLTIHNVERAIKMLNQKCGICFGTGRSHPEGGFRPICKICKGKGYKNETVS